MGILDGIEKLINEHGSATIRGERLIQAKEQYALLEKAKAVSDAKVERLEAQQKESQQEQDRLKQQIQELLGKHDSPHLADLGGGVWVYVVKPTETTPEHHLCAKCKGILQTDHRDDEEWSLVCSSCGEGYCVHFKPHTPRVRWRTR